MDRDQETLWAMLCHLVTFCLYLGVPFGNIIGPLVPWLIYRDRSRFIDEHGRESLNFQLSLFLYGLIFGAAGWFFGVITLGFGLIILVPLMFVYFLFSVLPVVFAAVDAKKGKVVRYPMTIRFL